MMRGAGGEASFLEASASWGNPLFGGFRTRPCVPTYTGPIDGERALPRFAGSKAERFCLGEEGGGEHLPVRRTQTGPPAAKSFGKSRA